MRNFIITPFILVLGAVALIHGFVVSKPGKISEGFNSRFSNGQSKIPTTNFLPNNLKVEESHFENLMKQLHERVSPANGNVHNFFPNDVESNDWDELEILQNFNGQDLDDDEEGFKSPLMSTLNDVSVTSEFGKHEFTFTKALSISKNGTKTFSKVRQSTNAGGTAKSELNGNLNTTLEATSSGGASFAVNITYSMKGKDVHSKASGGVSFSFSSKSKIEKRRLLSESHGETSTTVKVPSLDNAVNVNSSIASGSETFKLPFRSFLTLFGTKVNTSTDFGVDSSSGIFGEVASHVAFASKNSSLTKSCIKLFVRTKSTISSSTSDDDDDIENDSNDDSLESDDDNLSSDSGNDESAAAADVNQIVLVRAKSHTFTKVVSKSKSGIVLDVITCKKARAYTKVIQKGTQVVLAGSGQVSWEKSRVTIDSETLQKLAPHEYGTHIINKQLESNAFNGMLSMGIGGAPN